MGLLAVSRRRYISRNFRSPLHHAGAARAEGIAVTLHIKMYAELGVHKIANYYRASVTASSSPRIEASQNVSLGTIMSSKMSVSIAVIIGRAIRL